MSLESWPQLNQVFVCPSPDQSPADITGRRPRPDASRRAGDSRLTDTDAPASARTTSSLFYGARNGMFSKAGLPGNGPETALGNVGRNRGRCRRKGL
jgi:hypothetical protein